MNSFFLHFTIPVAPKTKKNHQRIIWNRAKKAPMIIPSPQYKQYEDECSMFVPRQKQPIDFPVNVKALFYMPTRRAVDLNNLEAALADILVKYRVLEDDNMMILTTWNGSEVHYDKLHPRTEVTITATRATFENVTETGRKKRKDRVLYTAHGKTQDINQWAEDLGVTPRTIQMRLAKGIPLEEVFSQDKRIKGEYKGSDKKSVFARIEREQKERELNREDDEWQGS